MYKVKGCHLTLLQPWLQKTATHCDKCDISDSSTADKDYQELVFLLTQASKMAERVEVLLTMKAEFKAQNQWWKDRSIPKSCPLTSTCVLRHIC